MRATRCERMVADQLLVACQLYDLTAIAMSGTKAA
jgi:hypothetical protein